MDVGNVSSRPPFLVDPAIDRVLQRHMDRTDQCRGISATSTEHFLRCSHRLLTSNPACSDECLRPRFGSKCSPHQCPVCRDLPAERELVEELDAQRRCRVVLANFPASIGYDTIQQLQQIIETFEDDLVHRVPRNVWLRYQRLGPRRFRASLEASELRSRYALPQEMQYTNDTETNANIGSEEHDADVDSMEPAPNDDSQSHSGSDSEEEDGSEDDEDGNYVPRHMSLDRLPQNRQDGEWFFYDAPAWLSRTRHQVNFREQLEGNRQLVGLGNIEDDTTRLRNARRQLYRTLDHHVRFISLHEDWVSENDSVRRRIYCAIRGRAFLSGQLEKIQNVCLDNYGCDLEDLDPHELDQVEAHLPVHPSTEALPRYKGIIRERFGAHGMETAIDAYLNRIGRSLLDLTDAELKKLHSSLLKVRTNVDNLRSRRQLAESDPEADWFDHESNDMFCSRLEVILRMDGFELHGDTIHALDDVPDPLQSTEVETEVIPPPPEKDWLLSDDDDDETLSANDVVRV